MLPKHVERGRFRIMRRLKFLISIEQEDQKKLDVHKTHCEPELITSGMHNMVKLESASLKITY